MPDELLTPQTLPLLIVISGPSGVGKDSVLQSMKARGLPFHFVVTATTRPQRQGEIDGVDYLFVSSDRFAEMIEHGELLEHALVYNDYKGIPKEQVRQALRSGKDVIMRLDVQGATTIRSLCPEALLIFLSTQTEDELIARLRAAQDRDAGKAELAYRHRPGGAQAAGRVRLRRGQRRLQTGSGCGHDRRHHSGRAPPY